MSSTSPRRPRTRTSGAAPRIRRVGAAVAAAVALTAAVHAQPLQLVQRDVYLMGTQVLVAAYGADHNRGMALLEAAEGRAWAERRGIAAAYLMPTTHGVATAETAAFRSLK